MIRPIAEIEADLRSADAEVLRVLQADDFAMVSGSYEAATKVATSLRAELQAARDVEKATADEKRRRSHEAPPGAVWLCPMCGKVARNLSRGGIDRGWDESCAMHACLVREDSLTRDANGVVTAADVWSAPA